MSSLTINDDHANLDSSMVITQDEQNNAKPVPDCPPTVRKEPIFRERTFRPKIYNNDKPNRYEERRENVKTQNNNIRKRPPGSDMYVDKFNGKRSNEKVLGNWNKNQNIERDHYTSGKRNSYPIKINRSNLRGNSVSSSNQIRKTRRDQVESSFPRANDIAIIDDGSSNIKPSPSTFRNFTKKSVHGERITVEQQATDNKSDVVKDLVAGLDSKDINDCGMKSQLSHPRKLSTDGNPRSRTLNNLTSPSSRRNNRSPRRRSLNSRGQRSYYSASYSKERSRSRRSSNRSVASHSYSASYSDRRSRQIRPSRNYRFSWSSSSSHAYRRKRPLSPYRRNCHESRDRSYSHEGRDRSYRSDRHDRNDRRDRSERRYLRDYRNPSRDRSPTSYRPYIEHSPRKNCYSPIKRYQQNNSQTRYSQPDMRKTERLNTKHTNAKMSYKTQHLPDASKQGQYTTSFASKSFQDFGDYESDNYNNFTHDMDTLGCSSFPKDTHIKFQIPPIYLYDHLNYDSIYKSLSNTTSNDYSISYTNDSVKLTLSSVQDYRSVIEFFETKNIKYLTFKYPIENPLSLVIHNIPIQVPEELVFTELTKLKYDIVSVTRLNNRFLYPIPVVGVLLAKPAMKIYSVNRLLNYDVVIEPKKPFNVIAPQCTNFQKV